MITQELGCYTKQRKASTKESTIVLIQGSQEPQTQETNS